MRVSRAMSLSASTKLASTTWAPGQLVHVSSDGILEGDRADIVRFESAMRG
jgi:hypothetical protein